MNLSDISSYLYLADAHMGTPNVPIKIEFDTGSPAAYIYNK